MPDIHLIVGNVGAGKSTFATRLSEKQGALIFSIDDWMTTLFWMDAPDPPSYDWALERTERIERQMLKEVAKIAERGVGVILDLGFFSRLQRERVLDFIQDGPHRAVLHYLDIDKEERWRRVQHRNEARSETYRFDVSREVFDFCERIFEPLDEMELRSDTLLQRYS